MKFIARQWDWNTSTWMNFTDEPVPNMVMGQIVPCNGQFVEQYNTNIKNQNLQLQFLTSNATVIIK